MSTPPPNTLYYGDNLDILRRYIPSESVDLVYLDPPFNSNATYNVLFGDAKGQKSAAQIEAFDDTWHWDQSAALAFDDVLGQGGRPAEAMRAFEGLLGHGDMLAYLSMMAPRLIELRRVLKPAGSIYLHCDPTASHYLKVLMDAVFGANRYLNEIAWCYDTGGRAKGSFPKKHDVILRYARGDDPAFYYDQVALPRDFSTMHETVLTDEDGRQYQRNVKGGKEYRYYLDKGVLPNDWWTDIQALNPSAKERLGYPTQKPLALLERIIAASSKEGDLVLDPFAGCGTSVAAAQKLGRRWIGIDITHLSIALLKYRLKDAFGSEERKDYQVVGEPEDLGSARQLAQDDRYQFQWWALSLIQARPLGGQAGSREGKKGSDKGIDGVIPFIDDAGGKPKRALVQVKSGKVKSGDIRDLVGTLQREDAAIGVFITLESATKDMNTEAAAAGIYRSPGWQRDYPRLQILTIEDLLRGAEVKMPPASMAFRQAPREQGDGGQGRLEL